MDALVVEASSTHVPWQRRFDGARPPAGTAAVLARLASIQSLYNARVNFIGACNIYCLPSYFLKASFFIYIF